MENKNSDFLIKLKTALDSGKKNDEIKKRLDDINELTDIKIKEDGFEKISENINKRIDDAKRLEPLELISDSEKIPEQLKKDFQEKNKKRVEYDVQLLIEHLDKILISIGEGILYLRSEISSLEENHFKNKKDPTYLRLYDRIDEIKNMGFYTVNVDFLETQSSDNVEKG